MSGVVLVTVTAALCWFDEPLLQLEECIRGLPTVADRVVAVDGGYARYPGAKAASPTEQAEVIRQTANDVGLDCLIYVPEEVWAGQVAKRSYTLQLTTHEQDPKTDWFMAVDADHIWTGERDKIRRELERTPQRYDGLTVKMFTPENTDRPIDVSAAGLWHKNHAGQFMSPQRIFRAYPDTRVERFHWWYSAQRNGHRVWLWGGDGSMDHARMGEMQAPFVVEHRCLFREPKQIERNRAFCEDRIKIVKNTGQEDAL